MVTQPDETQAAISGEAQNVPPQDEPDGTPERNEDDAEPTDSPLAAAFKAATEEPQAGDAQASGDEQAAPEEQPARSEPDADTILPPVERREDDDHPDTADTILPPVERKDDDDHPDTAEAILPPVQPKEEEAGAEEEGDRRDIPTEEEAFREGRVWYIIHTYSGHENKVKTNLEHRTASMDAQDLIFRVVVPTEDEIEIREGQRRTVSRKIFPGYILVQMVELREDDADSTRAWFVVRNTPGVTGFVGSGTRPVPLEQEEVRRILRQMRVEEPRVKVGFQIGQNVRIVDGPFQDFVGQVDDLNLEKGKVKVLVSFFGRETPVELDFLQVEKL